MGSSLVLVQEKKGLVDPKLSLVRTDWWGVVGSGSLPSVTERGDFLRLACDPKPRRRSPRTPAETEHSASRQGTRTPVDFPGEVGPRCPHNDTYPDPEGVRPGYEHNLLILYTGLSLPT